ncbi:MAG: hypothetical protein IKI11_09285 [Neisseriaceae bacterium]|nr:hypothetical protein [Neisseriaceae bacterium]
MQKTQNQAVAEQTNNAVGWDNPTHQQRQQALITKTLSGSLKNRNYRHCEIFSIEKIVAISLSFKSIKTELVNKFTNHLQISHIIF